MFFMDGPMTFVQFIDGWALDERGVALYIFIVIFHGRV